MTVKENREKLFWMLTSFADSLEYYKGKPAAEVANGFLDNEIAMEDGMAEYFEAVKDVNRRNDRLLNAIKSVKGKTFYRRLIEVIKDCEGISECTIAEIINKPIGNFCNEPYGRQIKGYWVCQRAVGTEGDSWEGTICVEIKPNKYFKFHYSM